MSKASKKKKYGTKFFNQHRTLGHGKGDKCKKRKYSRNGALWAILKAEKNLKEGKQKVVPKRSYYCQYCGFYHLTSDSRFDIKKGNYNERNY